MPGLDALTLPAAWPVIVAGMAIAFGAGIVRGYAGFGFSALSVAGLSLLVSPASVVPAIFMLEIVASVSMVRSALREVDWPWLGWLALGNALFTPLGVWLLAHVPEAPLRLSIGLALLTLTAVQLLGRTLSLPANRPVRLAVGSLSGLANGMAAIGGIVVAVLLGPAQITPQALRATMILLLLLTDVYSLAWAAWLPGSGGATLVGAGTWVWVACLAPAMLAGIAVGQRRYTGVPPQSLRRRVLELLLVVALLATGRALVDLWPRGA